MKKMLIGLMIVLFCANLVFAVEVNTKGLSEEQLAKLALDAARMKKEKPLKDKLTEYNELGETIGKTLTIVCKELGIQANEFAKTPVGKITIVIIGWKLIGKDIMQIIVGVPAFLIALIIWFYFYRRISLITEITYNDKGKKQVKKYLNDSFDGEGHFGMWALFLLIMGFGAIIIFV